MTKLLNIIGAGGHAKVVAELVLCLPNFKIKGFFDDTISPGTDIFNGLKVVGKVDEIPAAADEYFIVAIGNNEIRSKWFQHYKTKLIPATLIHPSAIVSPNAHVGEGSVVLPGSVISFGASIGSNCIVGSLCHIDHESIIGNNVYLRSSTVIGSNSQIPDSFASHLGQIIPAFSAL